MFAVTGVAAEVLKFGGSAFTGTAGFELVADYLVERSARSGRQAVVVVSAMSGTTSRLRDALHELHPAPPAKVSAMMLTTGELVSVAMLTAALAVRGVASVGLPPSRLGFLASGPADRARLISVDRERLVASLGSASVVVLPGGAAVDAVGDVAMLGRNSSDLSAVAAAVAVGADHCEIFSDVPGICSADPYLVPSAQTLPVVGYQTLRHLADAGAKVIQGQAIRWAEANGIELRCHSMPPDAACLSVVTRAPPVAAALLHERGDIWAFSSAVARERATAELVEEGIEALIVDHPDQLLLVVTSHGRPDIAVRCCSTGVHRPELRLLAVLHPHGEVEHLVVPQADALTDLRRRHDELYKATTPRTSPVPAKARSALSGLLTDGSDRLHGTDRQAARGAEPLTRQ